MLKIRCILILSGPNQKWSVKGHAVAVRILNVDASYHFLELLAQFEF